MTLLIPQNTNPQAQALAYPTHPWPKEETVGTQFKRTCGARQGDTLL